MSWLHPFVTNFIDDPAEHARVAVALSWSLSTRASAVGRGYFHGICRTTRSNFVGDGELRDEISARLKEQGVRAGFFIVFAGDIPEDEVVMRWDGGCLHIYKLPRGDGK